MPRYFGLLESNLDSNAYRNVVVGNGKQYQYEKHRQDLLANLFIHYFLINCKCNNGMEVSDQVWVQGCLCQQLSLH